MRRRPVCILCLLLVVFLCVTDWLGFSLIRGNPLPESVQTWIKKHPESTICGDFRQEVWFWCPGNWKKSKVRQIPENLTAGSIMRVGILIM